MPFNPHALHTPMMRFHVATSVAGKPVSGKSPPKWVARRSMTRRLSSM